MAERSGRISKTLAAGDDYQLELLNGLNSDLDIMLSGNVAGTPATLTQDCPYNMLGNGQNVQINWAGGPIVNCSPFILRHLSDLAYGQGLIEAETSGDLDFNLQTKLPVRNPFNPEEGAGYAIPVIGKNADFTGQFGALAAYSTTAPTSVSNVVIDANYRIGGPVAPGDYMVLRITQERVDCASAATDHEKQITVPSGMFLLGSLLMQVDSSASGDSRRIDGLVKFVEMDLRTPNGARYDNRAWPEIKEAGRQYWKQAQAEQNTGVAWQGFEVPGMPGRLRHTGSGGTLSVKVDTSTAGRQVEDDVTAATGDHLIVALVGYEMVRVTDTFEIVRAIAA